MSDEKCLACDGTGKSECTFCGGKGKVGGFLGFGASSCELCSGTGQDACTACGGSGKASKPSAAVKREASPSPPAAASEQSASPPPPARDIPDVERLLADAANDEAMIRIRAMAGLAGVPTDRALDEMVQVAGLDFKGEVRIAAIVGLASRPDRERTVAGLVRWMDAFGGNSTSGGNPKWSPALALAILRGNDLDAALAEGFDGREFLVKDLRGANAERAQPGADRIAFLLTWFMSIDGGQGFPLYIESARDRFPQHREILDGVLKWMARTL